MKYYILYNDENRGPLEIEEMEEYGLNPTSRVWAPGMPSWQDASEVPEIQAYFENRAVEAAKARAEAKAKEQANRPGANINSQAENTARNNNFQKTAHTAPKPAVEEKQEKEAEAFVEWYIAVNNQEVGPLEYSRLKDFDLMPSTLVWRNGLSDWTQASELPELAGLFSTRAKNVTESTLSVNNSDPETTEFADTPGNPFIAGIFAFLAAIAAASIALVNASYYYGSEKALLLSYCAGPALVLAIASLVAANKVKSSVAASHFNKAFRQYGLSLGLAIGGIVAAMIGCYFATTGFDLV